MIVHDSREAKSVSPEGGAITPYPSAGSAWFATIVLSLTMMVNFMDRGVITLLIDPIKRDLDLGDTEISLLVGFAFVGFYVLLGLPIARLVDSFCRKCILSVGIALWSAATTACAFASSFPLLMSARVAQGVGETTLMPTMGSMLSDYFPRERLPRAMSVIGAGSMIGTAGALIGGGAALGWAQAVAPLHLGFFVIEHDWQIVFLLAGIPGLLVAILMLFVREPKRRLAVGERPEGTKHPIIKDVVQLIRRQPALFIPLFAGQALITMQSFGMNTWMPALFFRRHGWSLPEYGATVGTITLIAAPIGLVVGAGLAEHLTKRGRDDSFVRTVMILAAAAIPFAVAAPIVASPIAALTCLGISTMLILATPSPAHAALIVATPNHMRGRMITLFAFTLNVIGAGIGPLVVALLTDYVFWNEAMVGWSLALVSAIFGPLAVYVQWKAMKPYGKLVKRIRETEERIQVTGGLTNDVDNTNKQIKRNVMSSSAMSL